MAEADRIGGGAGANRGAKNASGESRSESAEGRRRGGIGGARRPGGVGVTDLCCEAEASPERCSIAAWPRVVMLTGG